jgi:hypothetical protein
VLSWSLHCIDALNRPRASIVSLWIQAMISQAQAKARKAAQTSQTTDVTSRTNLGAAAVAFLSHGKAATVEAQMKGVAVLALLVVSAAAYPNDQPNCDLSAGLAVEASCLEPETDSGYELLFRGSTARLSERDKKAIYYALESRLAEDQKSFVDLECVDALSRYAKATGTNASERIPTRCKAMYLVTIADLNSDGIPDVFITGGSSYRARKSDSSIWLFTKVANGSYAQHFGFPAHSYRILKSKTNGFADIRFGGGFCEAVWRWDGKTYTHYRNVPTRKGGCGDAR